MKINYLKILIGTFALSFIYLSSAAQEKPLFTNNTLKYGVLKTSLEIVDTNKIRVPRYYIKVQLSDSIRSEVKKLNHAEWMKLLLDRNTDWAANLCLYDLFEKDAVIVRLFIATRKEWVRCCKEEDIEYWKKNLSH